MKKTTKRITVATVTACAGVALTFGLGATVQANASESVAITADNFYVRSAAVRVVDEQYTAGVNFKIVMEKSAYETNIANAGEGVTVKTGFLLAQNSVLNGAELTKETAQQDVDTTTLWKAVTYDSVEYMEATVYLYNIPKSNYASDIATIAYATIGDETVMSKVSTPVSLAYVANMGLEGATDEQKQSLTETYLTYKYTYTVEDTTSEAETVIYGDKLEAPIAPEKTGYEFTGWYNKAGTQAWDFENDTVKGNVNLYAKYEAIPEISIDTQPTALLNLQEGATTTFAYSATGATPTLTCDKETYS